MTPPYRLLIELMIGGEWVDITPDVRMGKASHGSGISITRGRSAEGQQADHGKAALFINNRAGKYSSRNPRSPYFGLLGRNTPIRISMPDLPSESYLYVSSRGNAITPDDPSLDITGDLDVRVEADLDWTANGTLISKYNHLGDQRSWAVYLFGGHLLIDWTSEGTSDVGTNAASLEPIPVTEGRLAVRVTLDVDNGAGGWTVTFYTADTLDGPWTQLGAAISYSGVGPTSIYSGTDDLTLGYEPSFTIDGAAGRYYRAEVRDGIDGTVVAAPDFRDTPPVDALVDAAGRPWRFVGAGIVNDRYRFIGEVPDWPPRWDLSGSDRWVPIEAAGVLRRLGQGADPLRSPLARQILSQEPDGYWPMEDEREASGASSALSGGLPAAVVDVEFAADDTLPGSAPLAKLSSASSRITASVQMTAAPTEWSVVWCIRLPATPSAETTMVSIYTTGTVARWDIWCGSTRYGWRGVNGSGSTVVSVDSSYGSGAEPGAWVSFFISARQSGSSVQWLSVWRPASSPPFAYTTGTQSYTGTVGRVLRVEVPGSTGMTDAAVGHLVVAAKELPFVTRAFFAAVDGYAGENVAARLIRLATEEGVPIIVVGTGSGEPMGPQRPATFLELMQEAADADVGLLYEDRGRPGLVARLRSSLYNQDALVVPYGYTTQPLEPVDDDQLTRNDVTVSRPGGGSVRAVQTSGPLNVNPPSEDTNGVGRYATSVTVNVASDDQLAGQAHWRKHLGTWDEARYPSVTVNMMSRPVRGDPDWVHEVVAVDSGDMLALDDLPAWLPPGPADQMVQGYTETLDRYRWDITWTTTPGGPWYVATVGSDLYRVGADGTVTDVVMIADPDDLTLSIVSTPENGPWTTDPADCPMLITLGGPGGEVCEVAEIELPDMDGSQTVHLSRRGVNGVLRDWPLGTAVDVAYPAVVSL